jgi:prepilin peptidase CpaA
MAGGLLSAAAVAVFLLAAWFDAAARRIPNALVLILAALGLARLLAGLVGHGSDGGLGAVTPAADIGAALILFAAGAALFHLSLVGGGDVKLIAAAALWLGSEATWPFLVVTAFAGGGLALAFLVWSAALSLPRAARPSLPYGIAIATGGILTTIMA